MQTTAKTDLRLAFDQIMEEAENIEIEGSPEQAVSSARQNLTLLQEAMGLASQLSPGGQSLFHAKVLLGMADASAHLGLAVNDGAQLQAAMERCDKALKLSVSLGTPEPLFEAQGLALRGNLFGYFGNYGAGIDHLEEVIATLEPAVAHFERLRAGDNPAALAKLDLTREDTKARELLDASRDSLREMRVASEHTRPEPAAPPKPWWKVW